MVSIAVVGCGATGVSFIRSLVDQYFCNQLPNLNLIIFESASTLGVGEAYQEDIDCLITDRPARWMSAHPDQFDEFLKWAIDNGYLADDQHTNLTVQKYLYLPRTLFGKYLSDLLENSLFRVQEYGGTAAIIRESVVSVQSGSSYVLETQTGKKFSADYIILCVGNNRPKDHYHLRKTPNYIHEPYPLFKTLKLIKNTKSVGILGSRQTAIDVSLSLNKLGHAGKISMLCRTPTNTRVRYPERGHKLKYFTVSAIQNIKKQKGRLTLLDAARLMKKELKEINEDWKTILIKDDDDKNFHACLREALTLSEKKQIYHAAVLATNALSEEFWNALDISAKTIFTERYQHIFASYRHPIPRQNAEMLLELCSNGKLTNISGLQNCFYDEGKGQYACIDIKGHIYLFDWIINATGPSKYVQAEDALLYNLIKQGLASEHTFGGVDVDFDTVSLIDKKGKMNPKIRIFGQNTSGVLYHTSSMQMLTKKIDKTVFDIINSLKH